MAMAQGYTLEEIQNILEDIEGTPFLDQKTKLLLRLAERVTREPYKIHQKFIQGLREHGLKDEEIFEAIAVGAFFNFMTRMADALGAPVEGFTSTGS
ncbi:hypothetical protein FVE67_06210 [Thermosulfurimonas marina]|uniref:Carboxymuconolactone decarboxylase-like domain-containing protein n=1 Tax=Thermosulfurimonas marina TaxID=2047767 RepID=A0A6H1WTA9_9BACT|nr:carboxymuconolactone decarboxylase family protein [Thermosulfurimonas marina]QJA06418.1 hypothetical protein FVE67_06210 [Thermosulfurimonas marina]